MPRPLVVAQLVALLVVGGLVARAPRVPFGAAFVDGVPRGLALAVAPEGPGRVRLVVRLAYDPARRGAAILLPATELVGEVHVRAVDLSPLPAPRVTRTAAGPRVDFSLAGGGAIVDVPVAVREGHGLSHVGAPLPVYDALRTGPRIGDVTVLSAPGTLAMGFQCGGAGEAYACVPLRARTTELVVPLRPSPPGRAAWVFAAALAAALAIVMTALLRRGAAFFDRLARDDGRDDPLVVAGFLARSLVSVLGFVGSIGVLAVFGDGRLPIAASLALAAWTVAVAVGIAVAVRTRVGHVVSLAWLALAAVAVAAHVTWVVPALLVAWLATFAHAGDAP